MSKAMNRRNFIKNTAGISALAASGMGIVTDKSYSQKKIERVGWPFLKTSVCAYSYREYFKKKQMTLLDFLEVAARAGFDGVEVTGYYFPDYPQKPDDELIYAVKKKAFQLGLDISGTATNNNFCEPDVDKRREMIKKVKTWVDVGEKLGAPAIRVFGGHNPPKEYSKKEIFKWMIADLQECTEYGSKHGVMIALENHGGIPDNGPDTFELIKGVDSEWIGVNLDTGNFRTMQNPYEHIEMVAPYAITCHVKVALKPFEKADMKRVVKILRENNYRGYLPIEYEERDVDPRAGVPNFLREIKQAIMDS